MKKLILLNVIVILLSLPFGSAAHYIIGIMNNALDGTDANDLIITLWNPLNGINDNRTDIIGPNGNSGADNIYMINCQLLSTKCRKGDILTLKVFKQGEYTSEERNVTVGGTGFTQVDNITLNSPPFFNSVTAEDDLTDPVNEINLLPATTKKVTCTSIITEYEGDLGFQSANGILFDNVSSSIGAVNDNNTHYTNDSCDINIAYGDSYEIEVNCSFQVLYYANADYWNCSINATDNLSTSGIGSDLTLVNALLALGVDSIIDFGEFDLLKVTDEVEVNVTNYGNVQINLSLNGYGFKENDGNAMNCTLGAIKNISIEYEKFNLSKSTQGTLTHQEFIGNYTNLTSSPTTKEFNLDYRTNDDLNDANKTSYWRTYVPEGIAGNCLGNIIFGAVQADGV
jgi:hypothetical protein